MKKTFSKLTALGLGVALLFTIAATIVNRIPTPAAFYDETGTNSVILGTASKLVQVQTGTNYYIGWSTNVMLSSTNVFEIHNGVITAVH